VVGDLLEPLRRFDEGDERLRGWRGVIPGSQAAERQRRVDDRAFDRPRPLAVPVSGPDRDQRREDEAGPAEPPPPPRGEEVIRDSRRVRVARRGACVELGHDPSRRKWWGVHWSVAPRLRHGRAGGLSFAYRVPPTSGTTGSARRARWHPLGGTRCDVD